jgi:hypothetical protein
MSVVTDVGNWLSDLGPQARMHNPDAIPYITHLTRTVRRCSRVDAEPASIQVG